MFKFFQISNPYLMDLIRRKVKLNHPYAGVFLKKNEEYFAPIKFVNSESHLIFLQTRA